MIDTSNFAPRDAKVIRENEGKTPYELLELGLSEKAYQRLISNDFKEVKEDVVDTPKQETKPKAAATIVESKTNVVQPSAIREVSQSKTKLTSPTAYKTQKAKSKSGRVTVHNVTTGRNVQMSASSANRLLKQPNLYKIIK